MSLNLLLALHAEHKQRTGHDIFEFVPEHSCDVCAYLNIEKESLELLERKTRELRGKL